MKILTVQSAQELELLPQSCQVQLSSCRGGRQGGAHGASCYSILERHHLHRHFHHCVRRKACTVSEHVTQKEDHLLIMDQEFGFAMRPDPPCIDLVLALALALVLALAVGWVGSSTDRCYLCIGGGGGKALHSHRSRCPLAPAILSSASASSSDPVTAPGKTR